MPVWVLWVRPLRLSTHAAILAHTRRHGMRQLQHLPQLPQIVISYSNGRAGGFAVRADAHLCGPWAVEPVSQFTLTKSPLPADFDRGDFLALRPKANRARGYAQPFR